MPSLNQLLSRSAHKHMDARACASSEKEAIRYLMDDVSATNGAELTKHCIDLPDTTNIFGLSDAYKTYHSTDCFFRHPASHSLKSEIIIADASGKAIFYALSRHLANGVALNTWRDCTKDHPELDDIAARTIKFFLDAGRNVIINHFNELEGYHFWRKNLSYLMNKGYTVTRIVINDPDTNEQGQIEDKLGRKIKPLDDTNKLRYDFLEDPKVNYVIRPKD